MTVCIAGICESLRGVVAVSDQMLTFGHVSVDGSADKEAPIHRNWFAMYSADDVADVRPILDHLSLILCSENRERALIEVGEAIQIAYAARHQELIEYSLLMPMGFKGLDDFHDRGRRSLSSAAFTRTLRDIEGTNPSCTFLVGGFDLQGIAHLIVQKVKSPFRCLDDPGFWAIGSGQQEAISSLIFQADKLGFGIRSSEAECLYHLLAAKFTSESNKYVGRETFVVIHRFNEPPYYLPPNAIGFIRNVWEEYAIPKMPKELINLIPEMIVTTGEVKGNKPRPSRRKRSR
jgi:hypothetical protein